MLIKLFLRLVWGLVCLLAGRELPAVINLEVAGDVLESRLRASQRFGPKVAEWENGRPGRVVPVVTKCIDNLVEVWSLSAEASVGAGASVDPALLSVDVGDVDEPGAAPVEHETDSEALAEVVV